MAQTSAGKRREAMKFGFWNFYTFLNKNKMFVEGFTPIGDELAYTTALLARKLKERGIECATLDMAPINSFDKVFFIDYPTRINKYFRELLRLKHPEMYLILAEPPIVRPDNYNPGNHGPFRKVITWKKDICRAQPEKYLPNFITHKFRPNAFSTIPFAQRKLCCLINSFMVSSHPRELYSERVRAIRWFEQNAPKDFDLIGMDWDRPLFPRALGKLNFPLRFAYRRMPMLKNVRFNSYPSFIGPNKKSKHNTLKDYKFCIAYENSIEPDYISEKLFDSFFAGCIPIYLGAPNVLEYIPAGTFIDKTKFSTYDALYKYISTMTEAEYNKYLDAIAAFINSPAMKPFIAETDVELFLQRFAVSPAPAAT